MKNPPPNTITKLRLKYLFSHCIGGAWGGEPEEDNAIVCLRAADFETEFIRHKTTDLTKRSYKLDEIKSKSLKEGDIIIEKSGGGENQPVGRVVLFSLDEPALCSNFLELLRPNKNIVRPKFAAYSMYSIWITRLVTSTIKQTTGIQNLDISEFLNFKIDLPSLENQDKVLSTLEKELEYLDKIVKAKENLLSYLQEKRWSLITHAITTGLNSKTKMKESGIEWLGKVPAHWEIERTRWLFIEKNERSETGEEELLTVSHITGVTLRSEKDVNMFEAETTEGYKKCNAGDLVINTLWAWMGAMGVSPVDGIVSPAYHVYTPNKRISPDYIDLMVRLPIFAKEVTRYSKGVWSSRLRLYPEGFYEVYMPVPPKDEQAEICSHIRVETTKIDKIVHVTRQSIELLIERRGSLINAAVTGQLEIA